MLVLQGMGQLVGHDHALVGGASPIGDEKFASLGIVHAGNLLGEQGQQLLIERVTLGNQAQRL